MSGPRIAVVDYEMGNLRSVSGALAHLGAEAVITADPGEVRSAGGAILPEVEAFGDAARGRLFATQFHPEKSQALGLAMLKAFVEMCRP